ncbi:MAG: Polyhydroxyalkanoic acid synthase [Chloroflexi bacterium]|nr:Polyhydroxyalkanoic acid synthase [Chloroflexota bacterium]
MSDKKYYKAQDVDQIGEKLQESYDNLLAATTKWAEILAFDPWPQTGVTPKEVVWRKNKTKLFRYHSGKEIKHRIPVLFTYALINKAYILDLTPGMSMIEKLVNDGFDVYLLEWGDFEWEDRKLTFDDFVYKYIARAVQKVCQHSHSEEISIVGYCMGGTMATMYASLFPHPTLKNLVLLAAPLRFDIGGTETRWLDTTFGNDVDKLVDTFELVPKEFVDIGVKMLKPVNNFLGTYSRLWKMVEEGAPVHNWKVLNKWVDDNQNFPGGAYRQWVQEMYHENKLIKGEFKLRGHNIDLSRITANLLVLAGENDHLVRPLQAKVAMEALSSVDKEYHEFPIGHGGLVFGKVAVNRVYPLLSDWLAARSD